MLHCLVCGSFSGHGVYALHMEYGLDWRHLRAWVIFSRMDMMGMIWTNKAHVKKSIIQWVMWVMHLFCVSDWFVLRWGVPVTSCSLSRWRTEVGERILSRVSRGAIYKAKIPRSITPAGLCWVWWLSGNTHCVASMILQWQSCRGSTSFHKLFLKYGFILRLFHLSCFHCFFFIQQVPWLHSHWAWNTGFDWQAASQWRLATSEFFFSMSLICV